MTDFFVIDGSRTWDPNNPSASEDLSDHATEAGWVDLHAGFIDIHPEGAGAPIVAPLDGIGPEFRGYIGINVENAHNSRLNDNPIRFPGPNHTHDPAQAALGCWESISLIEQVAMAYPMAKIGRYMAPRRMDLNRIVDEWTIGGRGEQLAEAFADLHWIGVSFYLEEATNPHDADWIAAAMNMFHELDKPILAYIKAVYENHDPLTHDAFMQLMIGRARALGCQGAVLWNAQKDDQTWHNRALKWAADAGLVIGPPFPGRELWEETLDVD